MIVLPNRIVKKEVSQYGIIAYDDDNLYPQRVEAIIANSGTASLCADWFARFVFGQGFEDVPFSRIQVNSKGLTMDKLLQGIIKTYSKYASYALHFNVNALGHIVEIHPVPFDFVRLGVVRSTISEWDGTFKVYDNWDRKLKRTIQNNDIDTLYPWTTDFETMLSYIERCGGWDNFSGMLYYHWQEEEGTYPLAFVDPELESCVTDSEIKQNSYTDVTNGLIQNTIFEYPGNFETTGDEDGGEDARREMEDDIAEGLGARGTRVKVIQNKFGDKLPFKIHNLAGENQDKRFEHTEKSVTNRIRRLYKVPPEFLDAIPGSLAGGKIQEAYDFFNDITTGDRMMFEEFFKMIADNWHRPLSLEGNFSIKMLSHSNRVGGQSL
jgi:hypothetical protein